MRLQLAATFVTCALVGCTGTIGGDPNNGGGGGGGGGGGPGGDEFGPDAGAEVCDQVTPIEIAEVLPPDLLLVVDKSGSMGEPLGTGEQKWGVMRSALTSIVATYADGINFGLMLFPTGDVCTPGIVQAGIAPTSGALINTALTLTIPEGGTPTDSTLTGALQYYNGIAPNPNGRYVLLATDGQPNCVDSGDPNIPGITQSIASINALSGVGIKTFVLGFGDGINSDPTTLQAMAVAGGTGMYYAANSPAELQAALDAIAGELTVPSCTFELDEVPGDPSRIGVFFDNTAVPRDQSRATGWDYTAADNTITFYGASCDQLQSGAVGNVRVDYGCGGPVVL